MRPAPGYTPRGRSASSLCPLSPPAINLVPEIRDPVVGELLGRTRDINIRGPTLEERGTRGRSLSPLPRRGYVAGDHFVTKDDLARREARVSPRSAHTRSISHTFPDSHSTIYNGQQWMLTRVVPEPGHPTTCGRPAGSESGRPSRRAHHLRQIRQDKDSAMSVA
ncbi:hypothetical protein L227DRAFT_582119 [Lentinus tigrinus ALCF2SS1-6]|uniref:Uncharacterized protein n=1 Tax=Lentinus tigrinus ALCF2SS1-6 TaxID=1328759 RepID=A0A5C2RPG0_9APHY|nr:hypothetical protein L227DRAFT_582119 [Lentinus tigrinus ALCF2SS1-6]